MQDSQFYCVAAVTRTMGRPQLLWRALESIACQTFKDVIWVIVNDGPREPVDAVAAGARARGLAVLVIHNGKRLGAEASSNVGIKTSCSKYVVIHDDDDSWDETFLDETTSFLEENSEYFGVATQTRRVSEEQSGAGIVEYEIASHNTHVETTYVGDVARPGLFPPIAFIYRRSVFDVIGYYDEIVLGGGDWDFHMRFVEQFTIGVIRKPLAFWHCRQNLRGGNYGNSRYDENGSDLWKRYEVAVSNRLIRRDMEAGRFGIGLVSGFARLNALQNRILAGLEYGLVRLFREKQ